jgi:Na+/H+ antiporter NhaC
LIQIKGRDLVKDALPAALVLLLLLPALPGHAAERGMLLKGVPRLYKPDAGLITETFAPAESLSVSMDGTVLFEGTAADLMDRGVNLRASRTGKIALVLSGDGRESTVEMFALHGLLSVLPPLVAIFFALLFRQVILALLAGVWLGSFFLSSYGIVPSLLRIVDRYVVQTLAGPGEGADHISIIVFTLLLGGMVGITSRMGGMQGIVDRVSKLATTPRRGQLAVWFMGVIIFFDDYTNTLIVGNSTRPLTDRLRVSREKLSYIVDSTAAPITALAVITSWIGFEISLINQAFNAIGVERNPLTTFVSSLPYSFYPILAVLFVLFIVLSGRDYGAMYRAERRARTTGRVSSDSAVPLSNIDSENVQPAPGVTNHWVNGIIPISVVIAVTFIGLWKTGSTSLAEAGMRGSGFLDALKESDSFKALLWGSFSGCLAAAVLALSRRLLSLQETMSSWVNGIRSMLMAIIILVLAWCIGKVCTELQTADYLVHSLSGVLSPRFLPLIIFLLAMGISFSTGTSWGTMSILIPIVIPLVYGTARAAGIEGPVFDRVLLASIAAILSGAVFGDHCSPISDTTIMSSMSSSADHIDHVKTQLPYALTVGGVSLVLGYLLVAAGLHPALSIAASIVVLLLVLRIFGRRVEERE